MASWSSFTKWVACFRGLGEFLFQALILKGRESMAPPWVPAQ
jgi:hypothetical protein